MYFYKKILSTMTVALMLGGGSYAEQFILNTPNTTMAFASEKDRLNLHYYGARVERTDDLFSENSKILEFPTYWDVTDGRNHDEFGYSAVQADGSLSSQLIFVKGRKVELEGKRTRLEFAYKDPAYNVQLIRYYEASAHSDVIETWTKLTSSEEGEVCVKQLSSFVLQTSSSDPWLTGFQGTWSRESILDESPLIEGVSELSCSTGSRTSQTTQPSFVLSLDGSAKEDTGRVIMGSLAWSGNFSFRFRRFYDNRITASIGMNPLNSEYKLSKGEILETPRLILTYSDSGKGDASRSLHRWARQSGIRGGNEPRMILLNSWEGAYFKFSQETIYGMMERAQSMGVELFVLDDGWFGEGQFARNSDKAGLGDWQVNREKLPDGIEGLIKHSKKVGIKFGIWVEPEMVNPKSQLFTDHPEWVIQLPNRDHRTRRNQLVLDLCNPAVQNYIFTFMDELLGKHPDICYIKWDCNSHFVNPGSTWLPKDRQSHLWIDYVKGYYAVLDRLIAKYPDVVFQACSSGGGRIDYGAMQRHHEFWPSDNTDALERIEMQWSLGHFYPAIAMASHVTVIPNHQTGRKTPLKFRFDVAMTGRLGFELDPKDLNKEETEYCRNQLELYKDIRPVVQLGELYRLRDPYQSNDPALMYVHEEKEGQRAILFAYLTERRRNDGHEPLRLKGLKPNALYTVSELGRNMRPIAHEGKTVSGAYLMNQGLSMHWPIKSIDYISRVIQLKEVK